MSIVEDTLNPNCVLLQVRMYSRALAIIGGFLVLASGAGEVYRQKPRSRSLQSTGQVFLGVYLICMVRLLSVLWIFLWQSKDSFIIYLKLMSRLSYAPFSFLYIIINLNLWLLECKQNIFNSSLSFKNYIKLNL